MLRNSGRSAACLASISLHFLLSPIEGAAAADPDRLLFVRPEDLRTVLFSQIDAGRSVFFTLGAKQTLVGPLDRTGFVVMETSGFGITHERFRRQELDLPAVRFTTQTSVLVGQQWNLGPVFLSALIGPEILHEQLTIAGQVQGFSEPIYGAKGLIELWAHPTRNTLLTATLTGTTAKASVSGRGSVGYRVWNNLFAGPEISAYATDSYQETKAGAHLTGFAFGILQGRFSAGWMVTDDRRRGSPYVSVAAWARM
ncbi:cellulose biosynthesis protein BcsS [Enterovirga sp. CN4-39]|uniref:cellulose biosynthesis protein BcsS n=1 Tax=Enterovirga sp. CN4-39 TaxID=3400910 RepID=UPI003BFEF924